MRIAVSLLPALRCVQLGRTWRLQGHAEGGTRRGCHLFEFQLVNDVEIETGSLL